MDSTERNSKSLLDLSNSFEKEVFFLVAQFLSGSQCQRAAKALIEELEAHELIPERVDWLGKATSQDFNAFKSQFDHIGHNHLPSILKLCVKAANSTCPTSVSINKSLLSSSTLSFLSRASGSSKGPDAPWNRSHGQAVARFQQGRRGFNPVHAVLDQAINGTRTNHKLIQPDFFGRLHKSCVILGHLSSVYCVLFDVTGNYIFTGADDNLIKIWSAIDGRLLHTLRGASSEITDLAVNKENTLLAAGSCDKLIRVWCLRSCAPIAVLNTHSGSVTSVFFCPIPRSRLPISYLASTSTDGSCSFWGFTETADGRVEFQPRPTIYQERMRPGHAQMICSSFSAGGIFMAAGSADFNVRVYNMLGTDGPERILEVEVHSDRVDSISWAHEGLRFISGSKDGTALIWRFENSEWRYVRLYCAKIPGSNVVIQEDPKRRARVTMVAWSADDSLVLTAVSDNLVKVWNPKNGELIRVLKAHQDEIFVTESHPFNPRLICTASHDGRIIIWDIGTTNKEDEGKVLFQYHNMLDQGQGHGAVFDCKWAPDGLSLAATDSHGHLLIFTPHPRDSSKFAKLPKEMFFHTDYRPLTRDAITNEVLDEQTQVPPHLMPPPFLVDMEGNPYQPAHQRLVPGRENCRDEQLVPNVAVGNGGFQEVIEGLPSNPRSNIDQMIEQLAIQLPGEQRNAVPVPRLSGGPNDRDRRVVGLRRSGDVEGVRQSTGNWQRGNYGFPERKVIMPLNKALLTKSLETRLGAAEQEEALYKEHCSRRPISGSTGHSLTSPSEGISLREARSRRVRRLALEAAERRIRTAEGQPNILEIEGVARPNPRPQVEISISQQSGRRSVPINNPGAVRISTARRGGGIRAPRSRYNVRRMFEDRGAQNESDIENMEIPTEEDSSDEELSLSHSSSSSSDSDSESDWGGGGNTRDAENRKRNAPTEGGRKSARKSNAASPKSEDANNDDSDDEPRPGPSSASTASPSKPEPKSKPKKTKPKASDVLAGLDEIPPEYRPSEWFAEVIPKRSPYFPQLGDHLVYYRQGHRAYVEEVEKKKAYELSKKMKKTLPYIMIPDLPPAVPVRVVNIKFELKPPRLVCLKLEVQDWDTGEFTGTQFNVQYHDMAQVVDFLILRQIHDKYVRHNWNPGDRFRCLIDRCWWFGTVDNFEPSRAFPTSKFLCYNITWDSKEKEKMSPWDMDIIPDSFEIPPDTRGSVPASDEDVRSIGLYEVSSVDWPPHGHQDALCVKLSSLIEQVMGLAISEAFLTPVDINRYPDYAFCIEYPVDLSTIKARLDNRFYRRMDALRFDVKYIATNAESFNQPNSDIVKHAKVIRDLCLELIENPDVTDVNPVYHMIVNNFLQRREAERSTVSKSEDRNLPSTSKSTPSRSDRSSATPASQQNTSSRRSLRNTNKTTRRIDDTDEEEEDCRPWVERCRDLLTTISSCKDAAPFRAPVNPEEYPDYYQAIDTPMDLQSVREDLLGGNYSSPLDFHKDMNLIFHNSRQFNTDKRSQIYSMTIRLQSMYECQVKPILTSYRSRRKGTKSSSSTPIKGKKKMPAKGSSNANSPRKNPVRHAASKNPYLHGENEDSSDADDDRQYSTRSNNGDRSVGTSSGRKLRSRASTTTSSSNRSVNGHGSHNGVSPPNHSRPQRRVKRFRISSGESLHSHRSNGRSHQQTRSKRVASAASTSNRKTRYTEDLGSDEFEDSDDVPMPQLHAAAEGDSDDASNSDHEASRGSLRRSSRVQKQGKPRSRLYYDNDSDDHTYGTRFRGKQVKNYDERDGSSGEEDVQSRKSKRRRLLSRSEDSPPRKLRRQETSPKKHTSKEEEDEEEEDDPDQPGPSSRVKSIRRSSRRTIVQEDDDDEEEEEENDEDAEEEEEEEEASSEEDDDRGSKRRSTRLKKKPDRHSYSDEDANQSPPRSRRHDESGNRRTRGSIRPDYAEDSDSEPNVSSRGRVRRKKSFLG